MLCYAVQGSCTAAVGDSRVHMACDVEDEGYPVA